MTDDDSVRRLITVIAARRYRSFRSNRAAAAAAAEAEVAAFGGACAVARGA